MKNQLVQNMRSLGYALMQNRFIALLILTLFTMTKAHADYGIVSTDGSGNISFTPGVIVLVLIGVAVATVVSAAALVLVWMGVKWIYRIIKGSK
jgi:hypothetical protein